MPSVNEYLRDIANKAAFNPTTGITIERLIDGVSLASSQDPAGTGIANAMKIEFGAAQGDSSTPLSLDALGNLTVNESGTYRIKVAVQAGRTGNSGTVILLFRSLINGVQVGRSASFKITNQNDESYFENDTWLTVPAGIVISFEVMRDSSGADDGSLLAVIPTDEGVGTWNSAPTAALRVERWTGV